MALNPIRGGLRPLRYDSNQVAKVQIQVQPGDELHVSDDIADQLQRADTHFKPIVDDLPADAVQVVADSDVPDPAPSGSRRRKA